MARNARQAKRHVVVPVSGLPVICTELLVDLSQRERLAICRQADPRCHVKLVIELQSARVRSFFTENAEFGVVRPFAVEARHVKKLGMLPFGEVTLYVCVAPCTLVIRHAEQGCLTSAMLTMTG